MHKRFFFSIAVNRQKHKRWKLEKKHQRATLCKNSTFQHSYSKSFCVVSSQDTRIGVGGIIGTSKFCNRVLTINNLKISGSSHNLYFQSSSTAGSNPTEKKKKSTNKQTNFPLRAELILFNPLFYYTIFPLSI